MRERIISAMNSPKEILSRNIWHLLNSAGISVTELASRIGVPQPTVYRIANAQVANPVRKNVEAIARYFGYTVDELYSEALWVPSTDKMENVVKSRQKSAFNGYSSDSLVTEKLKAIPVIALTDAATWIRTMDASRVRVYRHISVTDDVGDKAFAVVMEDDSMISTAPPISILPGYTLIIEPMTRPPSGKIVLALPRGASKPTIKMYREDGGKRFLEPLNQRYPIIEIDDRCIILGVAVRVQITLP